MPTEEKEYLVKRISTYVEELIVVASSEDDARIKANKGDFIDILDVDYLKTEKDTMDMWKVEEL